jgi:hypothetical protein
MPVVASTPNSLILQSGSTTLRLNRESDEAILQHKVLFWRLRPATAPLSQIADVTNDRAVDRASGVEIWHTMLILRSGEGWAFPAQDAQAAADHLAAIRQFLNLPAR